MEQEVYIKKTIFDIEIFNQKEHKYISKQFSDLINQSFKNFLERKFSNSLKKNIKIKSLEVNLGILHYNQLNLLENIFLAQLSNQIDFQLKYNNLNLENNLSNYINDYIEKGTFPWWGKNKKLFNIFFEKNIDDFKENINQIQIYTSNFNSFKRLYNLFSRKNLKKILRISNPKKYNLFEKIYSFKKKIQNFNHQNNLHTKSDIEIMFESFSIVNNKKSIKNILVNFIEREKKINTINYYDFEKFINEDFDERNIINYSSSYLSALQNINSKSEKDSIKIFNKKKLSNLYLDKEDFLNFFILNKNNYQIIFNLIENSFNKKNNKCFLKILNSFKHNLSDFENYILFLQKKFQISSLEYNVFKLFLRFCLVLYISKLNKDFELSFESLLVFIIGEINTQHKLNKKLIIKNLQSIKKIRNKIVNIEDVLETVFKHNLIPVSNRKKIEELYNFDLFTHFLKYDEIPYWSKISNLNKIDFYNYIKLLINNNEIISLKYIISNLDFKNKYLRDFINSNYFILVDIIKRIGSKNNYYFFLSEKKETLLIKYIEDDLWTLNINSNQLLNKYNSGLINDQKKNNYLNQFDVIKNYYTNEIIFYDFFLDLQILFGKLPQNKTYYILEFNNIFNKPFKDPFKFIFIYISKIFVLNNTFFNKIISLKSFDKIINSNKNYIFHSTFNLRYSSHHKVILNEIISKNIIPKILKELNKITKKTNSIKLLKKEYSLISKFSNFKEIILTDYKTMVFDQLIYFIEVGSIPSEIGSHKNNEIRKYFNNYFLEKPMLIKKYLHGWSKYDEKINRFLNIFNYKKDLKNIINLIHPRLFRSYILLMKNLDLLEIRKSDNLQSISSLKYITKALLLSWSFQNSNVLSYNTIINPILISFLKLAKIPLENITIFILRQVLKLELPDYTLDNNVNLKLLSSVMFTINIKEKVKNNIEIRNSIKNGDFKNKFLINHKEITHYNEKNKNLTKSNHDTYSVLGTSKRFSDKIQIPRNKILKESLEDVKTKSETSNKEARSSKELLNKAKSSKQLIDKAKTSKQLIDKAKTSKQLIDEAKTSEQLIDEAKTSKQSIDEAKISEQLIDEAKTSDQLIDEAKTSKQSIDEAKISEQLIDEAKISEQLIDEAKTSDQLIDEVKSSEQKKDENKLSNILNKKILSSREFANNQLKQSKAKIDLSKEIDKIDENLYNFITIQNNLFKKDNNLKREDVENISNDQIKKYLKYIKKFERKYNVNIQNDIDYLSDTNSISKIEDYLKINNKKKTNNISNNLSTKQIFDLKEGILINNSGLILFWPYLIFLFKKIGLIENDKFLNNVSKSKAILVCEYLVTGSSSFNNPSNDLILNKVLCGIDVNFVIDFSISLNNFEILICDSALQNVLNRWGKIKSISSLRDWFLIREGLLVENEESFSLNINSKPQDILLNHISWGIRMVFHKFMKKRINVDWKF